MSLVADIVPLRRDIDDAVDEAEASPIQKKPGEINGNQHPASHSHHSSNGAR